MNQYTDGEYVFYVSSLIGGDTYSICKRRIGSDSMSIKRWCSRSNPIVSTPQEAGRILEKTAVKRRWTLYFDD